MSLRIVTGASAAIGIAGARYMAFGSAPMDGRSSMVYAAAGLVAAYSSEIVKWFQEKITSAISYDVLQLSTSSLVGGFALSFIAGGAPIIFSSVGAKIFAVGAVGSAGGLWLGLRLWASMA